MPFFSLLKYVKSTLRCSLTSDVLNALMRVKIAGPPLEEFHRIGEPIKKKRKIQKKSKDVSKNIIDSSAESMDEDEEIED